ncbi:hypothetical protein GCM10012289_00990 [Nonomuraea cavernae]|uniref:Uncharacterized protein n=1 Tax=Nonomuraea cavernae TaxID=2045107 RepID=A0A917YN05_9ACTN|nr:hypothetical protein GCM10012289_00990 [Nonomuraea cavernae]
MRKPTEENVHEKIVGNFFDNQVMDGLSLAFAVCVKTGGVRVEAHEFNLVRH